MKRASVCVLLLALLFFAVWRDPWMRVAAIRQIWSPSFSLGGYGASVDLSKKLGYKSTLQEFAARFPDDPWWRVQAAIHQADTPDDYDDDSSYSLSYLAYNPGSANNRTLKAYDDIGKAFPSAKWLRTVRLQRTLYNFSQNNDRKPKPTPTPSLPPTPTPAPTPVPTSTPTAIPTSRAAGGATTPVDPTPVTTVPIAPPVAPPPVASAVIAPTPTATPMGAQTKAMLNDALSVAAQGTQAEPKNSFWDWTRAYCLFQLYRDAEALKAVQQGAVKPLYETHGREARQAEVNALQKLHPLDWDEKLQLAWDQDGYVTLNRCRTVVGLAVEKAVALERAGHHREALQIYDALIRLLRIQRLTATDFLSSNGVVQQQEMVWGGNGRSARAKALYRNPGYGNPGGMLSRRLQNPGNAPFITTASLFAVYARAHGRPDLAQLAVTEDNLAFRASSGAQRVMGLLYGYDDEMLRASTFQWLGGNMAWQMVLLAGAWALCMLLLGGAQIVRLWLQRRGRTSPEADAGVRPIGWLALMLAGLLSLLVSMGIIFYVLRPEFAQVISYGISYSDDPRGATMAAIGGALVLSAPLIAIIVGSWGVRRERVRRERQALNRAVNAPAETEKAGRADRRAEKAEKARLEAMALGAEGEPDDLAWLPLSPRTMRWLLAPFNVVLTWGTPLSWAALCVMGDQQVIPIPVAYVPGVPDPLVTVGAPGWGLSIWLTIGVLARWGWRYGVRYWINRRAGTVAKPESPVSLAGSGGAPVPRSRRRWNPVPRWRGIRDALGVALVLSAAVYVGLLWLAMPVRTRLASRADLMLRVGELRAAQIIATSKP